MKPFKLLAVISEKYQAILGERLCGIYLHGSLAFGCFNWHKSDIDFLVVVYEELTQTQKEAMILTLLQLKNDAPPKGFEMSVVLYEDCRNFKYPTPFALHFSNQYIKKVGDDLPTYCCNTHGTDCDLAAHFTVIRIAGIVLYGNSIDDVFGEVPKHDYLASLRSDIENAEYEFAGNAAYIVLNLCRVLSYVKSGLILSKAEGGKWGLIHLPHEFTRIVRGALDSYSSDKEAEIDVNLGQQFCRYMKKEIASTI